METNWFKRNYKTIIRISYIIPILVAAGISIYHVIRWYNITNPISWAIYLSIGVEIAALSALAGMTAKMNKFVYVPFLFVTLIQLIGNIFASYMYIDINGTAFKAWVELFNPMFESFGWVTNGNLLEHKRILGILAGAFIPLISLSFLHLLISFNDKEEKEKTIKKNKDVNIKKIEPEVEDFTDLKDEQMESQFSSVTPDIDVLPEEPIIETLSEEPEISIIPKEQEESIDIKKESESIKREPVIPTGSVKREEINEIKNGTERGFSVKIPKSNNLIERIGSNKLLKNNDMSKVYYKRDKNK